MQPEVRDQKTRSFIVVADNDDTKNILIETKKELFLIKRVTCIGGGSRRANMLLPS